MSKDLDRRRFLKIAGTSMGVGALYTVWPGLGSAEAAEAARRLGLKNGEKPTPFTFAQLSDAHVGFDGPIGTRALDKAVDIINDLPQAPDLILFTGDLTHDTEKPGEHAARMNLFKDISGRLKVAKDLARFPRTAPIVVFTHRPLFDLRPDWEWFTSDGDEVMNLLAPYENVTVLYGHIHREDHHTVGHSQHHAARSLSFAFPDPDRVEEKKPIPFDKDQPFKNLGLRVVNQAQGRAAGVESVTVKDVELAMNEYSGTEGFNQLLKPATF